jgi:hypothetical protein
LSAGTRYGDVSQYDYSPGEYRQRYNHPYQRALVERKVAADLAARSRAREMRSLPRSPLTGDLDRDLARLVHNTKIRALYRDARLRPARATALAAPRRVSTIVLDPARLATLPPPTLAPPVVRADPRVLPALRRLNAADLYRRLLFLHPPRLALRIVLDLIGSELMARGAAGPLLAPDVPAQPAGYPGADLYDPLCSAQSGTARTMWREYNGSGYYTSFAPGGSNHVCRTLQVPQSLYPLPASVSMPDGGAIGMGPSNSTNTRYTIAACWHFHPKASPYVWQDAQPAQPGGLSAAPYLPAPAPYRVPMPAPGGLHASAPAPGTALSTDAGGHSPPRFRAPAPAPAPSGHRFQPFRGKERKLTIRNAGLASKVLKLAEFFTEAVDMTEALYEALPKCRLSRIYRDLGRQPRPHEKVRFLLRHWSEINVARALFNVAENHLQDAAIGRTSSTLGRYSDVLGWDVLGSQGRASGRMATSWARREFGPDGYEGMPIGSGGDPLALANEMLGETARLLLGLKEAPDTIGEARRLLRRFDQPCKD